MVRYKNPDMYGVLLNMLNKKLAICTSILLFLCLNTSPSYSQEDGLGQTIQINTNLDSFVGKPSWLIIIRDIDHNQNIPYIFDFTSETNYWVLMTYGRNYLITASQLQFAPLRFHPRTYYYPWESKKINNFCHLESNGRIARGESVYVTLLGKLTPNTGTYRCHVSRFRDAPTYIAPE